MFAAIDVLEFPELHDESIPFMAFTKCLTRLMGAAGVRDFSLQVNPACGIDHFCRGMDFPRGASGQIN